jgi:predicted NBD/HSP70 family sugar kinase
VIARRRAPASEIIVRHGISAAILAEARHGAGRPYARVPGITLGAGLGACLVAGGAIVAALLHLRSSGSARPEGARRA